MLHRHNGDLYFEQVSLTEIAEIYGTPAFVYSETAIREAYRSFTAAFAGHPHKVCYAVKANSNLAVLQVLAELGAGFDIVSGGELTRVLRAGGDASDVVFSGVGKQVWEIELALEAGIACFNIESASEMLRIAAIAEKRGQSAPISIRVNPDVDPGTHPYIATGLRENKFGVSMDTALELYRQAADLAALNVVGIDCHIGSQITELAPFLDALDKVLLLLDQVESAGIKISHVDLGGGIGVRYQDEEPIDIGDFASAVTQVMGGRSQSLMFEPGRYIVANAGLLLGKVVTLKSNEDRHFAVIDAAMNDLIRPALYQAWQDVVPVKTSDAQVLAWDIVGPVCETGDFLARDRQLALREGDVIAILSSGAYGAVMSSNYNTRMRAPEIMVSGTQHQCIRRRESLDDLLSLESLLPRD